MTERELKSNKKSIKNINNLPRLSLQKNSNFNTKKLPKDSIDSKQNTENPKSF